MNALDIFFETTPRPVRPASPDTTVAEIQEYVRATLEWIEAGRTAVAAEELAARQRAWETYHDAIEPRAADVFRRVRACLDRVHADLASYTARLANGAQLERIERVIAVFPDRVEQAYTSEAARFSL